MQEIEIQKQCQGEMHRVRVRIENGAIAVSCPDHDFDLDEISEALAGAPRSKNFCLGIYTGWNGVRDVTLDQVHACIAGARSHGLTSKTARGIFGSQVAGLLYLGVRSLTFAERLLASLVWPTKVTFDPAAAERFVDSHPDAASADFAVAATAGGIGFEQSDVEWLTQEGVSLRFAVERLYEPQLWRLMTADHTRGELNQWWRTARTLTPRGNGKLVIDLVAAMPLPLADLELLSIAEMELLTTLGQPNERLLAHRLVTDFDICDAPMLVAIMDSKWTLKDLHGSSGIEIRNKAKELLRLWRAARDDDQVCGEKL